MRLAVISDIHGNLIAFEAILHDLEQVGTVDQIWFLGDFAAFGTRPAECVAKVRALQEEYGEEKLKVIGGNTDRYIVTGKRTEVPLAKDPETFGKARKHFLERDQLLNWALEQLSWEDYEFLGKTLGKELALTAEGYGRVIGFHAIPGDDEPAILTPNSPEEEALDALLDRSGRVALAGHTHQVMDRKLGDWRVINPGSVGMSLTDIRKAEWALLTIEEGALHVDFRAVPYDFDAVLAEMDSVGYPHPGWLQRFV